MSNIIYGLADPRTNVVRYIGKSTTGMRRPRQHLRPGVLATDPTWKGRWLRQLNAEGLRPLITVIENCTRDVLSDREIFWIAEGRRRGWPLTNLTNGGDGTTGRVVSASQIEAIGARFRGKKLPLETRAKISAANTGKVQPFEQVEQRTRAVRAYWADPANRSRRSELGRARYAANPGAFAAFTRGRTQTESTRQKLAASQTGKTHTAETRAKLRAAWVLRKARGSK